MKFTLFLYWMLLQRTIAFILALLPSIGPAQQNLAEAIAWRVYVETPLFREDKDRTSALLVAIAYRESSLTNDIAGDYECKQWGTTGDRRIGELGVSTVADQAPVCVEPDFDKPTSFCAFQIHLPGGATTREGWTGADLRADADKCVTVAYRMLTKSLGACAELKDPNEKLSAYTRGSCSSEKGKALSRDRFWLGRDILSRVTARSGEP